MVVGMDIKAGDLLQDTGKDSDSITCVACHGSKLNKRGKQCKKCKGSGRISTASFKELRSVISQETALAVERVMREQMKNLVPVQQEKANGYFDQSE